REARGSWARFLVWRDRVDMRNRGAPSKSLATPTSVVRGAPAAAPRVANAPVRASRISLLASATASAWVSLISGDEFATEPLTLGTDGVTQSPSGSSGQARHGPTSAWLDYWPRSATPW